jgi:hypothetical protein
MDDVYYLIHVTNDSKCLEWSELNVCSFNTSDQFPGVYFSIITKYNIDYEKIFPGKYILIFSKNLLYQHNYHINFIDYNGILTEHNTYYPWMLEKFVNDNKSECINKNYSMNEVIFHDNINMKYCCSIIINNDNKKNNILPKIPYINDEEADMTKIPFFCFPFEDIYTGRDPLTKSSNKWYNMFYNVANIDNKYESNIDIIVKKIKNKAYYLYNNRSEQNIKILYEYTTML